MRLSIVEEVSYDVELSGTAYDLMRAFLRDPNKWLRAVEERHVSIVDPQLSEEDALKALEDIERAERDS